MIRKLIGFILSIIVAVILFILIISLFPSRKKSVDIVNMTYIFIDDDGTEYDVFEPVHGAARDWSFLFWKKKNTGESENTDGDSNGDKGNQLGDKDYVGGSESGHEIGGDPFNLPEGAIEKPVPKDCNTPRGTKVLHEESVLAYQQRSDVPDICNVQRRTCNNGILDGSFTQPSCNENVVYVSNGSSKNVDKEVNNNDISYTRKTVISHNETKKSELIQTPKYAKNDGAEFDTKGKIGTSPNQPKTNRNNNVKEGDVVDYSSQEQVNIRHYDCLTPRGETVNHGQFVRAYEFPFGFTNATCEIELRLCVDGELKGSFSYEDCEYLDVTYEEYNDDLQSQGRSKLGTWTKNLFK